jgi:hypothetical protein
VRARSALYEFSSHAEFRETHQRWAITPLRVLIRPLGLKEADDEPGL